MQNSMKVRKPRKIYFNKTTKYWIGYVEIMKTIPQQFMLSLTNPYKLKRKEDPEYGIYTIADAKKLRNWLDNFIKYNER